MECCDGWVHDAQPGELLRAGSDGSVTRLLEKALASEKLIAAGDHIAGGVSTVRLGGVWGSSGPLAAASVGKLTSRPILYVTRHLDAADEVADDLEVFTGRRVQQFPAWEVDLGADHVNDEVAGERMRLCNLLAQAEGDRDEPVDLIVAPVMALLQPVASAEALAAARKELRVGLDIGGPDGLSSWLVDAGFERVEQVDQQGDFARRGGIVDVFPMASALAVRVEFFGDQIDSIRRVDLDTQRSTDHVDGVDLVGISVGHTMDPTRTQSLLSYLSDRTLICIHDRPEVEEIAEELYQRSRDLDGFDEQAGGRAVRFLDPSDLWAESEAFIRLELSTFGGRGVSEAADLGVRSLEKLAGDTRAALAELGKLADSAEVRVYCENPAERKRFEELLETSHPDLAGRLTTDIGHVHSGFHWPELGIVAVGHHEVFHRYAKVRRIRRVRAGRPIESLVDLHDGDYVVHVAHGIAKFEGLRTLEKDGREEEYLRLRFADNAVLHVPVSKINLVQRYIGTGRKRPNLSKLGGKLWSRQKQRVAEAVKDMAAEMLRIQAMRRSMPGVRYPGDTPWQKQFAEEFLYTETEDQLAAMQEIDRDLAAESPMDRLLCGDVGYGKTELAMRAAFRVVEAGRQVAVLVPTTVLAEQHYRTFTERLADYPFHVEMISRFRSQAEQKRIVELAKAGQVDVLIGTHRLLSKDVQFADLGLAIVDEEQRFGVEHKEHFKTLRASIDVLTLTATPIPRTLHMSLLGLRDISALATPPLDRRAIHTEVRHYEGRFVQHAIRRELARQGQVFFVHNRVMDIEWLAEEVRSLVPEARVAIGHGQMPPGKLEKIMLRFVRGEIDVLVCTTIIESGLDIPSANTMIIHQADRFGLAQLHQLRGRVGRYKHRAFCYLLLPETRPVTPVASKRLKAIEEFSDLGAGFQIAMRDLEIRGAGNILGREQSGHIATVGYELYCQLLEDSVRDLRGQKPKKRHEVHVELGVDAYLPATYVSSERQRMEIYRRLAKCESPEEIKQLQEDLVDAYGPLPEIVEVLLDLAEIRVLSAGLRIRSIIRMDPDIVLTAGDLQQVRHLFDGAAGSVRMPDPQTIHWRPPGAYRQMPTLVIVLLKRLREALAAV